jgi:hyperosmotically inducible periplasmic protein
MSISKWVISTVLLCALGAGSACKPGGKDQTTKTADAVDKAVDETKEAGEKAADDTKNVAEEIGDKTKEVAGKTADKTKEIAGEIADKSKDVVSATGEKITDGWITTKVSAKFVDETLLKDSKINVDSKDHVVTLKGTVGSNAAKARAVEIARGTEGVVRVIDQLVVNAR